MESQSQPSCLICGKKVSLNRGLCSTHHSRYYKQVRDLTKEQKAIYDQKLVERGLLLPMQKPGPKVADNPFETLAQELFAAESGEGYQDDTKSASKKPAKKPSKKPAKKPVKKAAKKTKKKKR